MPRSAMKTVLHQIRRLVARPGSEAMSDDELLDQFVAHNDESAFSQLVRRHGPLVMGVCLRMLRQRQDAEDAFQATFLILARKGAGIRQRGALSSWLYRVAFRVALRLKSQIDRRGLTDVLGDPVVEADPSADAGWRELKPVLDTEVNRLPKKYRQPMVLCYLEGKTYEEAARLLACPKGTVAIRLLRGREMLKNRLIRRGLIAATATVGALNVIPQASGAVPNALAVSVCQSAQGVAGGAALTTVASATVATLAQQVGTGFGWSKMVMALSAVVCLTATSIGVGSRIADGESPRLVVREAAIAPAAQPAIAKAETPGSPARSVAPAQRVRAGVGNAAVPNPEPAKPVSTASQLEGVNTCRISVVVQSNSGRTVVMLLHTKSCTNERRSETGLAIREKLLMEDGPRWDVPPREPTAEAAAQPASAHATPVLPTFIIISSSRIQIHGVEIWIARPIRVVRMPSANDAGVWLQ